MPSPRFSLAGKLAAVVAFNVAVAAILGSVGAFFGLPPLVILAATLAGTLPVVAWSISRFWRPIHRILEAVTDGVRSFQENDFSLRLESSRADELGDLLALYNRMGDVLRLERNEIYQRELLLDTLLQGAPMAILLVNSLDRIVYANSAARVLFAESRRLHGKPFAELVARAPDSAREPLENGGDALFAWSRPGAEDDTYRLVQRRFQLNTQEQRLVVVERITPELRRQEVEVWKKVIRVLSHELNNSLASVSSLLHSARHVSSHPRQGEAGGEAASGAARLDGIFEAIDERVRHLSDFLDGYARFARLPRPARRPAAWSELLGSVERMFPFRRIGEIPSEPALFDPVQMQQVLINLLKNAAEAGGPPEEIAVAVERAPGGGWLLAVLDRGRGMDDDTMKKALLPFYSSKQTGSGLGLPLCNEIMSAHGGSLRLEKRAGGGTAVVCTLPE
ncbi:MAG TPA: ATP-binding protein [Thermoanaerobaculia bacterium]|nr:ATP-binding protein [Thermoanaerobaculia bacterium]